MARRDERYTVVAIVLHWAIAITLLAMIPMGWWMGDHIANADPQVRAQAAAVFQFHKSLGLTILVLSLARLGWRLANPPPPAPPMPGWQGAALKGTHVAFYVLMIALPLTGWVYVSAGWAAEQQRWLKAPTIFFGLFQVPHIAPVAGLEEGARRQVGENAISAHSAMAWAVIGLTALHVAAALKHHVLDKDDVLGRMIPGLKPLSPAPSAPAAPGRLAALGVGFGVLAVGLAGLAAAFPRPGPAADPQPPAIVAAETPARGAPAQVDLAAPAEPAPAPVPAPAPDPVPAPTQTAKAQAVAPAAAPEPAAAAAAPAGPAPAWAVDAGASAIRFSGTHAGAKFDGRFDRWNADIRFDPANLAGSRVTVTIETGSAATGDAMRDASLTETEWFNPKAQPTARFEAVTFTALGANRFAADGRLTIKGVTRPLRLPFTLDIAGETATMRAQATVDRTRFDLGMSSDAAGEWVSKEIELSISVKAQKQS